MESDSTNSIFKAADSSKGRQKRDIERKGGGVRKVERQSKAIKMHFYEQNY